MDTIISSRFPPPRSATPTPRPALGRLAGIVRDANTDQLQLVPPSAVKP